MGDEIKLLGLQRKKLGSAESRRLRNQGRIPANIYGLGRDSIAVTVDREILSPIIHAGTHVVEIEVEGDSDTVVFREIQWDTFGKSILHIDLLRIDPTKQLTIEVPIELKGIAAGVLAGGVLDQLHRTLSVSCLAHQAPDHIVVRVADLQIGEAIHVSDLEALPGVDILDDPETLLIRVLKSQLIEVDETAEGEQSPAQPELIGREKEEESTEEK